MFISVTNIGFGKTNKHKRRYFVDVKENKNHDIIIQLTKFRSKIIIWKFRDLNPPRWMRNSKS